MTRRIVSSQEIEARAALRKVERALKKLRPEQGRAARRNARARLASAIRKLRRVVDGHFPRILPAREQAPGAEAFDRAVRSRLPAGTRKIAREERAVRTIKKLRARGWENITHSTKVIAACAEAGLRVRRVSQPSGMTLWVPGWVAAVPYSDSMARVIRDAKGNATKQRAILSAKILRESLSSPQMTGTKTGRWPATSPNAQTISRTP